MEARMKEDIIAEVTHSRGRILLHREEYNPALNISNVIGYWENVLSDDVKTPAEVYAALTNGGFNIEHRRIPLTREREALAADIDAIQSGQHDSAGHHLFVSHTGLGGVAYAMAITCLRLNASGQFASERPESFVAAQLSPTPKDSLSFRPFDEEALKQGDYRDILNLTRVLMHGPKSKAEVDAVIERYVIFQEMILEVPSAP
ncbi:paladin isoform X1 [Cinnamomum micranthum f. kanehirae]|uniref:Paladin isoform X1 n=1 Tax=Cinnamomum micranthum f. kanehirae TaxID=337451 RepID=A0A443PWK2_9MAGN|nr:paladin isoform X1 [Cinnamomum micranthum f. kanehirae]